jgi:hypothetical protein
VPDETGGGRADAELRLALAHMSESPAPVRASRPAHRTDYVDLASHHQSGKNRRRPGQRFG